MAVKKSDNVFVRAAKYRKEHPRTSFQNAIKIVAKKPVSKVSGVKKPRRKSVTKTTRITTVGVVSGHKSSVNNDYGKGKVILKQIDKYEAELKRTKGTEARNFLKRIINAEHDKLDRITKKRKSA